MINPENTCFFTGHRMIANAQLSHLKNEIQKSAADLIENHNVTDFITGGAIGFDTIAAYAILELKQQYPQIKLHLYLPCTNQTQKWSKPDVVKWNEIYHHADSCYYVFNHPYINGCMQMRNRAMVNDSKFCIAYCTRPNSGTYSTIIYAKERGINITMIK